MFTIISSLFQCKGSIYIDAVIAWDTEPGVNTLQMR